MNEAAFLTALLNAMRYTGKDTHEIAMQAIQLRLETLPDTVSVFARTDHRPWVTLFRGLING